MFIIYGRYFLRKEKEIIVKREKKFERISRDMEIFMWNIFIVWGLEECLRGGF